MHPDFCIHTRVHSGSGALNDSDQRLSWQWCPEDGLPIIVSHVKECEGKDHKIVHYK